MTRDPLKNSHNRFGSLGSIRPAANNDFWEYLGSAQLVATHETLPYRTYRPTTEDSINIVNIETPREFAAAQITSTKMEANIDDVRTLTQDKNIADCQWRPNNIQYRYSQLPITVFSANVIVQQNGRLQAWLGR